MQTQQYQLTLYLSDDQARTSHVQLDPQAAAAQRQQRAQAGRASAPATR